MFELKSSEDFAKFLEHSNTKPLFLLKHSTACGRSAGAIQEYEKFLAQYPGPEHALVKVIESRSLSNEIERSTGILHESPQVLLFVSAKVVWHAKHRAITKTALEQALRDLN